jgi:hypothetical protein
MQDLAVLKNVPLCAIQNRYGSGDAEAKDGQSSGGARRRRRAEGTITNIRDKESYLEIGESLDPSLRSE